MDYKDFYSKNIDSYIDNFQNNINILPNGYYVINSINDYLKSSYKKLGYLEHIFIDHLYITHSSENCIFNTSYENVDNVIDDKHFVETNILLNTYGKFDNENEKARFNMISLLEVIKSLGEKLLSLPFVCGKNVFSNHEDYLVYAPFSNIGFINVATISYLGKCEDSLYYVNSSCSITNLLKTTLSHYIDNNLVINPYVNFNKVVIIPIKKNEAGITKKVKELSLKLSCFNPKLDLNEEKSFDTYIKQGYNIILKLGPMDLNHNVVEVYSSLDNFKNKELVSLDSDLELYINELTKKIVKKQYYYFLDQQFDMSKKCKSFDEVYDVLNNNGIVKAMVCDNKECVNKFNINNIFAIEEFNQHPFSHKCIICQKEANRVITLGKIVTKNN